MLGTRLPRCCGFNMPVIRDFQPADIETITSARQQPAERSSGSGVSLERFEALEARIAALEARLAELE